MEDESDEFRSLIQHEDTLRNQRLGWLLTANGFLFAALAFSSERSDNTVLSVAIAAVGLSMSLSTMVGLHTNTRAIGRLRDLAESHRDELRSSNQSQAGNRGESGPPVVGISEKELSESGLLKNPWALRVFRFMYPWQFIPLVLAVVWAILGLVAVFDGV